MLLFLFLCVVRRLQYPVLSPPHALMKEKFASPIHGPFTGRGTRWTIGIDSDLFLQTITNCKYIVKDIPYYKEGAFGKAIIDALTSFGDQRVQRLKLALPLGVAYEHYMTESEALKLQPRIHRQSAMMKAGIVREEFEPMLTGLKAVVSDSIPTPDQYMVEMISADVAALQADTFRISEFRQNYITGHIDLKKKKLLFLSIPLDEGWHITVDGKPVEPIMANYAFIGLPLEMGSHDVALVFKVPLLQAMGLTSLCSRVLYVVLVLLTMRLKLVTG